MAYNHQPAGDGDPVFPADSLKLWAGSMINIINDDVMMDIENIIMIRIVIMDMHNDE